MGGALELADSLDFSDLAETSNGSVAHVGGAVSEVDADEFSFALSMLDEHADEGGQAGLTADQVGTGETTAAFPARGALAPDLTTLNPAANEPPKMPNGQRRNRNGQPENRSEQRGNPSGRIRRCNERLTNRCGRRKRNRNWCCCVRN